ncbi:MAG: hypothetical protein IKA72_03915 [Clostridia bacterium]|nr:hypothetical protein [Clostridia bacterium]
MERFLTRPESIKTRIKKSQRRSVSVGIFYWVGILLLFCFSIFPYVGKLNGFNEMNGELWIITFMTPIMTFLNSGGMTSDVLMPAVVAILYILNVLAGFICAIVATTRLFRITKRNPTNKLGYNRAGVATKVVAKCFALMFSMMFALTAIGISVLDGTPTLFFYIAFGLALVFHFIGNFRGSKISFFQATEDRFNPVEMRPVLRRGASLARNVCQFVCILVIIFFVDKLGNSAKFFEILDGKQLPLIEGILIPGFMFVILLCLLVAIVHVTSTMEYNRFGRKPRNIKKCRVCAFIIALLGLASAVLALITPAITEAALMPSLVIFAVALLWFIVELILSPSKGKREKKEKVKKVKKNKKKKKLEDEEPLFETVEEVKEQVKEEKEEVDLEEDHREEYTRLDPSYFVADFLKTPDFEETNSVVEQQTEQELILKSLDNYSDEEIEKLRNKWLNLDFDSTDGEKSDVDKKLLTAQQIRCPGCDALLNVRFGWTKVKCPKCETVFKMKKKYY